MPKTKISEFSATPANNTDIDSINIAEGCAPSGINDAIRELMAQLKDFQTGAVGDSFNGPVGTSTAAAGAFTTLSASSTLSVTGAGSIQGLTVGRGAGAVSTNTAVGSNALAANSTGAEITAVGRNALAANTVNYATAVGANALTANTTGAANAAFGAYALSTNTTGAGNSAFGALGFGLSDSALQANTTGSYNSAFGLGALAKNTTATGNTALGYQAGYTNQTGVDVVYIGYQAGYTATGNDNTFVGSVAGKLTTTGAANTAVGGAAGYSTTTGAFNTSLGRQALFSNTTASSNTAVGYQAGYSTTTGAQNTTLGVQAGYSTTTGLRNTFIGGSAGYNTTTGSYNTYVGSLNSANSRGAGTAMTTGSNNVIIGNYDGNYVGIDIRTSSNNIVLSDGDGAPRLWVDTYGNSHFGLTSTTAIPAYSNGGDPSHTLGNMSAYPSTVSRLNIQERANNWITWTNGSGGNNGVVSVNGAGVTYGSNSDYRLKEDVAPLIGALARVAALKPVTFKWIIDGSSSEGFIAHEVQEIIPLAVKGEKDGMADDGTNRPHYQSLDASMIIATLTAAIQEQQAIILSLKARLDAANL